MVSEKKQRTLEKVRKVREELKSRVGTLHPSAELVREDRSTEH